MDDDKFNLGSVNSLVTGLYYTQTILRIKKGKMDKLKIDNRDPRSLAQFHMICTYTLNNIIDPKSNL